MPCFWCKIHIMTVEYGYDVVVDKSLEEATDRLKTYLRKGRYMPGYKLGIRAVYEPVLRQMALEAGFTELAVGCLGGVGVTDMEENLKFPQAKEQRIQVSINSPNRYGIGRRRYDGLDAVGWVIDQCLPDYTTGCDPLRAQILEQQLEVCDLNSKLSSKDKTPIPPLAWSVDLSGKISFWYNPLERNAKAGAYPLSALRGYANENPHSMVLKANQKTDRANKPSLGIFEKQKRALDVLCTRSDKAGRRLFRIAMLKAPRDLADRYVHHLEYLKT